LKKVTVESKSITGIGLVGRQGKDEPDLKLLQGILPRADDCCGLKFADRAYDD